MITVKLVISETGQFGKTEQKWSVEKRGPTTAEVAFLKESAASPDLLDSLCDSFRDEMKVIGNGLTAP
jgi:hypothetical protein